MLSRFRKLSFALLPILLAGSGDVAPAQSTNAKVTWHWHMHQPIYWNDRKSGSPDRYEYVYESQLAKNAGRVNPLNDLNEIFGKEDRVAGYQYRMRDSIGSIGIYTRSGAAVSYSGALMENVNSLGQANQWGYSPSWKGPLQQANGWSTTGGFPRLDFTNFSFHHALLALHNDETVYMEVKLMQEKLKATIGPNAVSDGFFPTEMAFSTRMIPVLQRLGIKWTIVSGEAMAKACPDFPIQYGSGGLNCDPPNRADQINPNGVNFVRDSISRGCAPVNANPFSYQPAYAKYVDPSTGVESKIILVPADQAQSWNDGYGCLSAGFFDAINLRNNPSQPSIVVLSHDGDNAFGGGFSYYNECVPNLANGANAKGNQPYSIRQYLAEFPPNPASIIHITDGAWVNADGDFGSPTYINWNYPLLDATGAIDPKNGWHEKAREMAVFTAALNRVLTAQQLANREPSFADILDPKDTTHPVDRAWHYYLGSLDSGNVYYGTALDLEAKGAIGCNEAVSKIGGIIGDGTGDATAPTIWLPQRQPYNPGSVNFGVQYRYRQFINNGDFVVWTFISDVSGPATAKLKYRLDVDGANPLTSNQNETFVGGAEVGDWLELPMVRREMPKGDPYNKPDLNYIELPLFISDHFHAEVKDIRSKLVDYHVEAVDAKGNTSRSPIQHVWVGSGEGSSGGGGGSRVTISPDPLKRGEAATVTYNATGTPLDAAPGVFIHRGKNNWANTVTPRPQMMAAGVKTWGHTFTVDGDAATAEMVFTTLATGGTGTWDNNGGADWKFTTVAGSGGGEPTLPPPNPFVMDGALDADACDIGGNLYVQEKGGWLYVATNSIGANDVFLYVSGDPTTLQNANWAKAGQVGAWNYFLAAESSSGYTSWFDATGVSVADVPASLVKVRNGAVMEGAMLRSTIPGAALFVARGAFGNADGGALVAQSPTAVIADGSIQAAEFLAVTSGTPVCGAAAAGGWMLE